jgi:hypothetical protein
MSTIGINFNYQAQYISNFFAGSNAQVINWNQATAAAPVDPNKPWKHASSSPTTISTKALFVRNGGSLLGAFMHYMQGTDIPANSLKAFVLPQAGFNPKIGDTVVRAGQSLTVATVDAYNPNGNVLCWLVTFDA